MKALTSLLLILAVTASASAFEWTSTARRVLPSLVQLQTGNGDGFCSGWVIDNTNDYVMTADHCMHNKWTKDGVFVDGILAMEVAHDSVLDFAVLYVSGIDRPALQPDMKPLEAGQPIAALGFGYGFKGFMFRSGVVSNPDKEYPDFDLTGSFVELGFTVIGGMSGGPVINSHGKVVSIVQMGTDDMAFGRPIGVLWRMTRSYWQA